MTAGARVLLTLGFLYALLTVWWVWPLPTVLGTHTSTFYLGGKTPAADQYLVIWILSWDSHALATEPWNLFRANTFFPSEHALAYSEHLLGYVPFFAPLYGISGNPVLAYNATMLLTYPLSALAMYALARRWMSSPAAAVAGLLYAFVPARYFLFHHSHQLGVQWIPLAMLLSERWLERGRARDAVLLAATLLLQALTGAYLALALAAGYVPYLALALWGWRARLDRRRVVGLALACGAAAAVFLALSLPYLELRRLGLLPAYLELDALPPSLTPAVTAAGISRYLRVESAGVVCYALALAALVPGWSSRRPRVLGLALVVTGVMLAFGPGIQLGTRVLRSPYLWFADWVPALASVRLPGRFLVVTQLGLALLAGIGLDGVVARARPVMAWSVAGAAAVLALASYSLPPLPLNAMPTGDAVPSAYRWLASHGQGRPLLELPAGSLIRGARRMYLSTYHWLPIMEGYSGYPPKTAGYLHEIARGLPAPGALQELVDTVDVGWVLVHRGELPRDTAARWVGDLPPGLERVGEWQGDLLLSVTGVPREDRHARLLNLQETLGGVPLAPLEACPGTLVLTEAPSPPWPPGRRETFIVELLNQGATPWPAHGFVPRHLVRLLVTVRPVGGGPQRRKLVAIEEDVRPGRPVRVPVRLVVPRRPGRYVLELALVQVLDGPLVRCGVAPVAYPFEVSTASESPGGRL